MAFRQRQPTAGVLELERNGRWLPWIVLAGFCLYVGLRVEPPLRYHASAPVFFRGADFLSGFASRPGGLVQYCAAFLAQLDCRAWLGALVFAVQAGLLYVVTRLLLNRLDGARIQTASCAPPYLLLLLHNRYDFPVHEISTGLLPALWLAIGYLVLPSQRAWFRLAVFWLMALLLVWCAGPMPCLLFVVLGGLHELVRRRHLYLGLGCGLAALLAPVVANLYGFNGGGDFRSWGAGFPLIVTAALYSFYPLAALALILLSTEPAPTRGNAPAKSASSPAARFFSNDRNGKLKHSLQVGLILAAGVVGFLTLDVRDKALLRLNCLAEQKKWDQVLAIAPGVAAPGASARLLLTQALFHTGRLGSELFTLRQVKGEDILPDIKVGLEVCQPLSETLLELGQVNLAEHFAHEALELDGPRPRILKQLAWINILKDRPQAARVFLNRLRKVPFHADWAERCLQGLSADPRGAGEEDLARLRSLAVTSDNPGYRVPTEELLQQLLQSNPRNRMAFEYLMAYYLTTVQLEKLMGELGRLDVFRYSDIPRHYEEAILLYQQMKGGRTVELKGRRIRPETTQRFERLQRLLSQNGGRTAGLEATLSRDFGDTFWFYYLFGRTAGGPQPSFHGPVVGRASSLGLGLANAKPVGDAKAGDSSTATQRLPRMSPDYSGTTIPPNIAPLNFIVEEPGVRYGVRIHASHGAAIEINTRSPSVVIPPERWKELLRANAGQPLYCAIAVQDPQGQWHRFDTVTNMIAREDIDGHLVYRLIGPVYTFFKEVGIYQRDLEGYRESTVLHNQAFNQGCVNCHTFLQNRPETMALNIRHKSSGNPLLLVRSNEVANVAQTAGYLSWHPSGRLLAFSSNKLTLFFHTIGEARDVFDANSDLRIYRVDSNTVVTPPPVARPDRLETWPAWSPDGTYLYFCSAPITPFGRFRQVRYDLVRVHYDLERDTWGEAETLVSARDTGLSANQPRVSPDGRWLLFCLCKYGNFPVYQPSSDLYVLDLQTRQHGRLDINSGQSDSWHSWSSNGRWIVFSSKRRDGLFSRPYFSYVDRDGNFHKPFLLPQKDPAFYDSFLKNYNVPELVTGPVQVRQQDLAHAILKPRRIVKPATGDKPSDTAAETGVGAPAYEEAPGANRRR